ncbi:hypothetical protein [Akkermansia sp.]|uniref:hypothetical protein n=1 Tax=Akkermansia sp. TaxID=1872421 RepID=UPI003AB86A7F
MKLPIHFMMNASPHQTPAAACSVLQEGPGTGTPLRIPSCKNMCNEGRPPGSGNIIYNNVPALSQPGRTITISHPQWNDEFRITHSRGCRLHRKDHATVLYHDGEKLVLKWDDWGKERFIRRSADIYHFTFYECTDSITPENVNAEELSINPFDRPGKHFLLTDDHRPTINIRYLQWDMLLHFQEMYQDVSERIRQMPCLKSVLLAGLCKDCLAAVYLAFRLSKKFPELSFGVWGCPWVANRKTADLRKGPLWSWENIETCNLPPYSSVLLRWGDPADIFKEISRLSLKVRGFAFYGNSPNWNHDRECTERLNSYLCKHYIYEPSSPESCQGLHTIIIPIIRQNAALYHHMINDMFSIINKTDLPEKCEKEALIL